MLNRSQQVPLRHETAAFHHISAPKCFGVPEGGRPAARPDVTEYLHDSGTASHGELTLRLMQLVRARQN
jgi:hypothetical protein